MTSMEDANHMSDLGDSTLNTSEKDVEAGGVLMPVGLKGDSPLRSQKAPEPPQNIDGDDDDDNDIEDGRNRNNNSKRESLSSKSALTDSLIVPSSSTASSSLNIYKDKIIVLVNLELLNSVASNTTTTTTTTLVNIPTPNPVNKFGFAPGYGRNADERIGPYLYVACSYRNVRTNIVTVERYDTGEYVTIQTPEWETHVLTDDDAIIASVAASRLHTEEKDAYEAAIAYLAHSNEKNNHNLHASDGWNGMIVFWDERVVPLWRRMRASMKSIATKLVLGASPFSLKIRITGINLLVVCSVLFLFLQVFQLGYVSPQFDDELAILGLVVWCILVLELTFEVLIRPKNYHELLESEKAYRPSTARYINSRYVFGETLALVLYIPELICFRKEASDVCLAKGDAGQLLLVNASIAAVLGPTKFDSLRGRLLMGSMAFRLFGVIRRWQHMLIQQIVRPTTRQGLEKWVIPFDPGRTMRKRRRKRLKRLQDMKEDDDTFDEEDDDENGEIDTDETEIDFSESKESRRLKSAANIGTALIVVNCQRVLILMVLSVLVVPLFYSITDQNHGALNLTKLLQAENIVSTTGLYDCNYLEEAIDSWLNMAIADQLEFEDNENGETPYVLWARVLPVRCPFQDPKGVITSCSGAQSRFRTNRAYWQTCDLWESVDPVPNVGYGSTTSIREYFARELNLRGDGVMVIQEPSIEDAFSYNALDSFAVTVVFDHNPTIMAANQHEFILLAIAFLFGLIFLVKINANVYSLALNPIQRMLRIVIRYAENPLAGNVQKKKTPVTRNSSLRDDIGDIETEQLLSAITKISDLLRKCWGVAGAGIISSNLGRQKDGQVAVFNPTVPGKQVYALFGFVTICGYSRLLKALDGDVMILINDIANVVHNEIYRWALGDHGQCNKNLGPCFLMVWRIGDFNEVQQKNKAAIEKLFRDKVYKTKTRNHPNLRRRNIKSTKNAPAYSNATTVRSLSSTGSSTGLQEIQLESLPGIQSFADRALLGMLKSFAGLHRDRFLQDWKNDPRLRRSRDSYSVDVIYGMDAGWAVEGAVGSEYKIDATYLSPHVNMASRMMSASKQYGATILLSKAVEKLLSKPCRSKLRHLDTVYVKGSAIKQAIYTYDARSAGVDFFLLERTPEQADSESESYTPTIWDKDSDLIAMRRHATDEFLEIYHRGVKQYLEGKWAEAYELLEQADDIMIETVLEEGYIEIADDDVLETLEARIMDKADMGEDVVKLRHEFGDGACRTLMNYMKRRNFEAPEDWDGVRKLFSK
eukprot:CAMPEP_0116121408 /NCGR_PEP_ID=MMETSP0329-20121206/3682_1 /TAXON_ID=697910 /ORGANISM="Pseudo-nitzschia arenysensis, Strain B593" /LENGTH=1270 /DNA_ID=CAMNT_0003615221 /DNA_START=74 /DNA_END=3886 /DNA_ORIENTATION=+